MLCDVKSFTYGPFVSRFWMLRKHTILMDKKDLQLDPPFYGWDCITLGFDTKQDIHLIIKSEEIMTDFLKLLIYNMQTINGIRGTGIKFKERYIKELIKVDKSKQIKGNDKQYSKMNHQVDYYIMRRVLFKYRNMRVRQKISFHAFMNNETVLELWLKQIKLSFLFLSKSMQIPKGVFTRHEKTLLKQLMSGNFKSSFTTLASFRLYQELSPNQKTNSLTEVEKLDKMHLDRINAMNEKKRFDPMELLRLICDKSKCYDIFQATKVNNLRMYQKRTIKDVMFYSIEMKKKEKMMKNIQLLKRIGYKILSGYGNLAYVHLSLEEIKLSRELFIFQVELGDEAAIPHQLNQLDLGQSYTFYNPILSMVEAYCSDHKRQLFNTRQEQLIRLVHEDMMFWSKAVNKLFYQTEPDDDKIAHGNEEELTLNLYQKYTRIDKNEIDYLKSQHSMAIQNSQYVKVENCRKQIQKHQELIKKLKDNQDCAICYGKDGANLRNQRLNLRFCNDK